MSAIIANEIARSSQYWTSEKSGIRANRAENIEYMRGELNDLQAPPNRSSMTSRDLSDVVSWTLPSLMRLFTSSGRMAEFEPEGPEDEEYAEQVSEYLQYIFFKDNDGYGVLYDASYDALAVAGDGVVKHWWDDTPVTEISTHSGLTAEQIAELTESEGVEILAQDKNDLRMVQTFDDMGNEIKVPIETWDVKIEHQKYPGCTKVIAVEPENFIINEEAIDIEDFRFCAHRDPYKTRSDLIEMGFDAETVEQLPGDPTLDTTEEGYARRKYIGSETGPAQRSQERIELYECYIKADTDGDGVSEVVRAYYAGDGTAGTVLDWDVWEDEVPFSKIPCYPVPHQFLSESLADRTKDIQRVKTVLLRGALDNLYASQLPGQEVEEGSVLNPDILVNKKFGATIWKKRGSAPIIPHEMPFVADKAIAGMEFADTILERRTGLTRMSRSLDPDALQNQTAEAVRDQRDVSYSQTELIARNMADGWRKVFRALLRIIVKHQDFPRQIRFKKEWVPMDPRHWNANMDCTINVGLGTGSKDRDMAMLNVLLQGQREMTVRLAESGFAEEAIEMLPKVTDTLVKIGEAAGIRNADDYFPAFDDEKMKAMREKASQPRPDPEIQKEQMRIEAQAGLKDKELQVKREEERMKAEGNRVKEAAQLEADLATRESDRQANLEAEWRKLQWEREKQQNELQFKYTELGLEQERENEKMAMATESGEEGDKKPRKRGERSIRVTNKDILEKFNAAVKDLKDSQTTTKRVLRDDDGKVIGVENVTPSGTTVEKVARDADGNITGLEKE